MYVRGDIVQRLENYIRLSNFIKPTWKKQREENERLYLQEIYLILKFETKTRTCTFL
jgi:hypothetical protein